MLPVRPPLVPMLARLARELPDLVAEVAYDQVDGTRFRHPARFRHWRPDRDARSCRLDQLLETGAAA